MTPPIEEAVRLIRTAGRIALATHVGPDGDAIGSLLAAGRILESLDKEVVLLCDDPVPGTYRFLPGSGNVRAELRGLKPDLLIGLDSNDAARLGRAAFALVQEGLPTVNIDHHVTNDGFGTLNLVDTGWVSTTEAVLALLDGLGLPLDEPTATCLLTGLVTDTRGFRTTNVTPRALAVASRLMEAGASLPRIVALTLDRRSLLELEVIGEALANVRLDEQAIWTVLPFDKRKNEASTTGLSSMLLSVDEARVAGVFREKGDGTVDISLRAAPGCDVASLAVAIGGGGHTLAAGATVDGPLDAVVERVVTMLKQAARDGKPQS